jgi:hypothetical protein
VLWQSNSQVDTRACALRAHEKSRVFASIKCVILGKNSIQAQSATAPSLKQVEVGLARYWSLANPVTYANEHTVVISRGQDLLRP